MNTFTFIARDRKGHTHITAGVSTILLASLADSLGRLRLANGQPDAFTGKDWTVRAIPYDSPQGGFRYVITAIQRRTGIAVPLPGLKIQLLEVDPPPAKPKFIMDSHFGKFSVACFEPVPQGIFRITCDTQNLKRIQVFPDVLP